MSGVIVSIPPQIELPPGNNASNPVDLIPPLNGFTQFGVGAITLAWQSKVSEVFSVTDFGVKGNGTDETAKIQKALDAISANGGSGSLYFPGGKTYYAVELHWNGNYLCLHGDGPSTVLSIPNSNTNGTLFTGVGGYIDIEGMTVQHPTQNAMTGGFFFRFSTTHATLRNIIFSNGWNVARWEDDCNQSGAINIIAVGMKNDLFEVDVSPTLPPAGQSGNLLFDRVSAYGGGTNIGCGLRLMSGDGISVSNSSFLAFQNGVIAAPSASRSYLANLFFSNVIVDGAGGPAGAGAGWAFDGTNNPLLRTYLSNCTSGVMGSGLTLTNTRTFSWVGGTVIGNGIYGILVGAGAYDTQLNGLIVTGNSTSSIGTYDGILVYTGADKVRIKNCRSGTTYNGTDATTQVNSQAYGIHINDPGTINYEIVGNDVSVNASGGINDNGGAGGNKLVQDNIGYADAWIAYTPTITAGSGTFTTVSATGRYRQIGKTVFFQNKVTITTNGSAAGSVIGTLPVAMHASAILVGVGRENTLTGNTIQIYAPGGASTWNAFTLTASGYPGGSGTSLHISGTYEAA